MKFRALRIFVPRFIKRWLPASLFARTLLIIVLPVVIMQAVVTWIFFDAHWQTVTSGLSDAVAGDIAWVVETYQADPGPEATRELFERAEQHLGLSVRFLPERVLPTSPATGYFQAEDRALDAALSRRLDTKHWFDNRRYPGSVDVRVAVTGGYLRIIVPRERVFAPSAQVFVLWLSVATLLLTTIAILFIRNQVRAIERLAQAADAFGKGVEGPEPFKPYGAREVRQAAQAFIAMKARIQRHIDQRTTLLASVSHDLRTPLTRLKLELAMAEPGKRTEAMKRDLAEMEHMVDEYLDFARGEAGEAVEPVDLAALLGEVADGVRRGGGAVELVVEADLVVGLRPNAIRRAVANLLSNALGFGTRARLSALRTPAGGVEIAVEDDGPGIPEDRYEEAFKPFNRLDEARNQNRKGVGLGLAIARDVARGHGGDVRLERSPLGGLRAIIRLPG